MKYNKFIDHTLLKQDATKEGILKLCSEAKEFDFASVCVNPDFVSLCAKELKGTDVKVCTVIGFPLGATDSQTKAFEASQAIKNGASEIDMVINVSYLKDRDLEYVRKDIQAVREATKGYTLKVIIETCLLTDEEKVIACQISKEVGVDFVKTSTGFSTGGANVHDIELMRKTVGPEMGVKASGGIRDFETMVALINAGASRIGASCGVKLCSK